MGTILIIALGIGIAVVVHGTVTKGPMGVNLKAPKQCPTCSGAISFIRKPADAHEAMYGGWTCQACGTKLDKWGQVRQPAS